LVVLDTRHDLRTREELIHRAGVPDQAAMSRMFEQLRRLTARPAPFAPHTARFWDDPHISRQLLTAHLDPATDAASRPPEIIDRTVDWLTQALELRAGQRLLDLGCGPGLYAERFAMRGVTVTGLDVSRTSLAYARQRARQLELRVAYHRRDYRALTERDRYDGACLIYYDLAVLSDAQRDEVLARIHTALRSGGRFAFDVRTTAWRVPPEPSPTWRLAGPGFWRRGPYLELTRHFSYAEPHVHLRQTAIVEPNGQVSVYRFWDRLYTVSEITTALDASGFQVEDLRSDLCGTPYAAESEALGVVARKR
jgi:SAM-dependent methyltransferase